MSSWPVIQSVAPVFLFFALGMVLRRLGVLPPRFDKALTRLLFDLLFPCLIIHHVVGNPEMSHAGRVIAAPVLGFATALFGMILALLLGPLTLKHKASIRSFAFTNGIYNFGFIPIAIISVIFPPETLGLLFVFNLGVHVCAFSVGVILLSGSGSGLQWKHLVNGPLIGLLAALGLHAAGVTIIPGILGNAVHWLGVPSLPLGIILAGAGLYDHLSIDSFRRNKATAGLACLIRLALCPLCFLMLAAWAPFPESLKQILVVQAAMPAGMLTVVIVRYYGSDSLISSVVIASTMFLSAVTMPAWILIGMKWVLAL